MMLNDVGFENVALHAMIKQRQRLAALARFKSNTIQILIATDVASRGLDIPTVQLVINHTLPKVPKEYIHRVGRTARAGRGGRAISLVSPRDIPILQKIEEHINMKLKEFKINGMNCYFSSPIYRKPPSVVSLSLINSVTDKEVGKIFTQISVSKSEAYIKLDEEDFYEKRMINKRKKWILEGLDPDDEEEKLSKKRKKRFKKDKKKNRSSNKEILGNEESVKK